MKRPSAARGRRGLTPFTRELRRAARPVWEAIFAHPFVVEVGRGTLSRERFSYFIRQDYLYLQDFARVLCLAGAKAERMEDLELFAEHAANAVRVERALHGGLARKLGLRPRELETTVPGPVTVAYTRHLLAVARGGSLGEIVAAVLPCYWIYWEVGERLKALKPPEPLLAEWVNSYASEAFGALVRAVLAVADRLGEAAPPAERARMGEHFLLSSRYEHGFWEQAYKLAGWPV